MKSGDTSVRVTRPLAVDLYSGVGGLSLGMEQAGFDVGVAAEFDAIHAITHRYNFPHTPVLHRDLGSGTVEDIADLILETAKSGWRPDADEQFPGIEAVVGGPPCQGFSVGGVRNETDERNEQFVRFVSLVIALRPMVFCLENVAGLLESRFDDLRHKAFESLRDAGYNIAGHDSIVNAVDYGVPQRRRRVIVTGSRIGSAPRLEAPRADHVTVAEALQGLPDLRRYGRLLRDDFVELRDDDLINLLTARSQYARQLAGVDLDARDMSWRRKYDPKILTSSLRTVHRAKTVQRFSRTQPGEVEPVSHLFRLNPSGQARTLRAGTGADRGSHTSPRPIHPSKSRVITVREAARLHGYPDWFRFHSTNWHGHRQVGNSVPPPLAAAVGRALFNALGVGPARRPDVAIALGDEAWLRFNQAQASASLRDDQLLALAS